MTPFNYTNTYKFPVNKINVELAFYGYTFLFPEGKAALESAKHFSVTKQRAMTF